MIIKYTNIIILISIFICCSCSKSTSEIVPYSKAIFVYMAADNNLDYYGIENINQVELALYQNKGMGTVYLYIDRVKGRNPEHPYLLKIIPDNTDKVASQIVKVYPEQDSCNADVLESSLKDVLSYCQSNNENLRGLVLWSHGSAWLPKTNFIESDRNEPTELTRSFGFDISSGNSEMSIIELYNKLKKYHFEFLIFDACFMSSIEVIYQLKDSFDYIIASPTEILANGFPYANTIEFLFEDKIPYEQICSEYVNSFESKNGVLQSASIAVIKTSELDDLAKIVSVITKEKCIDFNIGSAFQYERGRNYWIFDLGEYISSVTNKSLQEKAIAKFKKTIPIYKHTEYFYNTIPLERSFGISVYIPNSNSCYDKAKDFYEQLRWSNESNFINVYYDNSSSVL